jgi:hypothetical protein
LHLARRPVATALLPALLLVLLSLWASASVVAAQTEVSLHAVFSVDDGDSADGPDAALPQQTSRKERLAKPTLKALLEPFQLATTRPGDNHRIRAPPR